MRGFYCFCVSIAFRFETKKCFIQFAKKLRIDESIFLEAGIFHISLSLCSDDVHSDMSEKSSKCIARIYCGKFIEHSDSIQTMRIESFFRWRGGSKIEIPIKRNKKISFVPYNRTEQRTIEMARFVFYILFSTA